MKRLLITFAVICLFGEFASGQTTGANTGPTSFGASDEHEYDSINLATLVPTFHFPVVSKTGAISFGLSIESPQICHIDSVPSWTCGNNGHFADFTPTLTTALWDTTAIYFQTVSGGGTCYTNHVTGLTINGSYHAIPETDIYYPATCASISANVTTSDGSYIKATITSSGTTGVNVTNILLPSGFTSPGSGNGITSWSTSDTFGNVVKEAYSGNPCCSNTYTDTLNASVTYSRTSHNYSYTDTNGSTQNITLTTGSNLTFLPLATQCVPAQSGETVTPFTAINYPDGTSVGITWDPNPRLPGTYSGLIGSITLRTGGTISYTYAEGAIGSCTTPSWNFASLTRTTPDGTTTYSNVGGVTTVLDPGKNKTVYSFAGANPGCSGIYCISVPVITQIQRYQNTGTVASPVYTLLATDVYCYNGNQTNCTVPSLTFPITQRDVYHTIAGMSTSSRVTETYDTYGNRTSIARYDFGAATFTAKTTTTYGSWNGSACALIGNNVYDHPCDVLTTDGTHTISETRYTYNGNGAQTAKAIWTGSTWLTTTYTPNSNGTVASIQDPNGQQASFGYAPTGSGGCNGLLQTSSSTTVNGVVLSDSKTWDCNGGVVLTTTDPNGNGTVTQYDSMFRKSLYRDPSGYQTTYTYTSNSVSASASFGSSVQNRTTYIDALGRFSIGQVQQGPSSSTYDTKSALYSFNGPNKQLSSSAPCPQTIDQPCGTYTTTITDPLGRPISSTDPLGGTTTYVYNKNDTSLTVGPAPSGEHVKTTQTEIDGLGRIKSVCSLQTSGGTSCGQSMGNSGIRISYSYSFGTGSATVTKSRGVQNRPTTYDAMGHVTSTSTPEAGVTQYVYDSDSSCNIVGLTGISKGDLISKADANGNKTCYGYDSLHRLTDIAVLKNGACYPPVKRFRYDSSANAILPAPTGYAPSNIDGRMFEAWTGDCVWPTPSSGFDSATDEWFSYDASGRMTNLWESTTHIPGYYHGTATYAPNGVVTSLGGVPGYTTISYGLDGEGRLYSAAQGASNLVSGVTYNSSNQPQAIHLGSAGDSDGYEYDDTGRMTKYTFTVGTTPKSISGSLTWNPNGTLRTLAITDAFNSGGTQTCNFGTSTVMGYDDLGRLLSADCGSAWQQTFSYDQYDNITKSGSSSWAPGYDVATNHALSPITYDNNGNLTYDTFHHYAWYVDNKLGSTDSTTCNIFGSTDGTCILYDAFGREVERGVNGVYTEVMYTPVGKTAIMNGQTTTTSAYFPLPGGATYYQTGSANGSGYFWHKDWIGSVRLSSSVQNRTFYFDRAFAPYGEMYKNFGNTLGLNFTGDTQDSFTGLYDTPNRELIPSQGRWLSPDPAGASWNAYSYPTDPNSVTDPSGAVDDSAELFIRGHNLQGFQNFDIVDNFVDDGVVGSRLGRNATVTTATVTTVQWDSNGEIVPGSEETSRSDDQAQNQGEGSQANLDRRDAIANNAVDAKQRADLGQKTYGPNQCSAFVSACITKAGADAKFTPDDGPPRPPVAGEWANKKADIPGWRVLGPNEKPAPGDVAAVHIQNPHFAATGDSAIVVRRGNGLSAIQAGDHGVEYNSNFIHGYSGVVYRRYEGD